MGEARTGRNKLEQQEKDTGLALLLILLLLIYFTENLNYIFPAFFVLVLTMTWPKFFSPVSSLWFGFSRVLGEFVSKIILTVVFWVIAVPIGLCRQLLEIDSMKLKQWEQEDESCFADRNHTFIIDDLTKPY